MVGKGGPIPVLKKLLGSGEDWGVGDRLVKRNSVSPGFLGMKLLRSSMTVDIIVDADSVKECRQSSKVVERSVKSNTF